jgi:hypothetical protein
MSKNIRDRRKTVVLKRVGQPAEVARVEVDLKSQQKFVGGHIEYMRLADDIVACVNETGRLEPLPLNACGIFGDFQICRISPSGNVIDLTDRDIERAKTYIEINSDEQPPQPHIAAFKSLDDLYAALENARIAQQQRWEGRDKK